MRRCALLLLLLGCSGGGGGRPDSGTLTTAMGHYTNGRFEAAEEELANVVKREPENVDALRLYGRVLLLRNKLQPAAEAIRKAIAIKEKERRTMGWSQEMLILYQEIAVALYRMDDYANAAVAFRDLGEGVLASKYRALAGMIPYAAKWDDDVAVIPFVGSEPVPTVRMRVNDVRGVFAIDTSSGEIVLDQAFASKAGVKALGVRGEAFTDPMEEGYVQDVTLGSLNVRNVPIRMRKLSPVGKQDIDGILGTNFLLHFSFTIDYKRDQLILRPAGSRPSRAGTEIPFFVAGERFIVIPGKLVLPASSMRDPKLQREHSIYYYFHTGFSKVPIGPSQGLVYTLGQLVNGKVKFESATYGPVTLQQPAYESAIFPSGLDTTYGFTIGAALGHEAFRGRALTFEPERMILTIE